MPLAEDNCYPSNRREVERIEPHSLPKVHEGEIGVCCRIHVADFHVSEGAFYFFSPHENLGDTST